MSLNGTLSSWNDDRGFGFIAPKNGGADVFVHISAFPRDGLRPSLGEALVYELGRGKDGRAQAVRVYRQAIGQPPDHRGSKRRRAGQGPSLGVVLGPILVIGAGFVVYKSFSARPPQAAEPITEVTAPTRTAAPALTSFQCDGRTHCSQMTSCAEATYFLRNCPGTEMDGDNDGVPCEQQWCNGPLAR